MTSSGRYDEDVAKYVLRDCLQIAREVSSFLRILVNSSQFLGVLRELPLTFYVVLRSFVKAFLPLWALSKAVIEPERKQRGCFFS